MLCKVITARPFIELYIGITGDLKAIRAKHVVAHKDLIQTSTHHFVQKGKGVATLKVRQSQEARSLGKRQLNHKDPLLAIRMASHIDGKVDSLVSYKDIHKVGAHQHRLKVRKDLLLKISLYKSTYLTSKLLRMGKDLHPRLKKVWHHHLLPRLPK
ncbi:unknown [Porphyromonas sp. CAG:1061]|nr:unknown [Porphyromonas sp. CAG:1061]